MMNILLVNTFDAGGAAKACLRLHEGLLQSAVNSKVLLRTQTTAINHTYQFEPIVSPSLPTPFYRKVYHKLRQKALQLGVFTSPPPPLNRDEEQKAFLGKRHVGLEYFSFPTTSYDITQSPLYQAADIINLHWVADFLDWETFFAKNTKPLVWTLHDQNPFLGGEHYAERYLGIDIHGKPIHRQMQDFEIIENNKLLTIKKAAIKSVKHLHIVAPSKWLLDSSKNSEILGQYPHFYIPYGFPTNTFRPYAKEFCRDVLEIPQNKIMLLFVADSLTTGRKGYEYLSIAITKLLEKHGDNIILCAIGNKSNLPQSEYIIELGKITHEKIMAMAYSAADGFIIPSLEDNLPNTMIESILCGTPIIGFPTGGIKDVVVHGENGYLCDEISVNSLQQTIELFIQSVHQFDRPLIAQQAFSLYHSAVQAKAYINLYQNILKENIYAQSLR
jgi:glycosyltransferase involved in cell wall biosynthesis